MMSLHPNIRLVTLLALLVVLSAVAVAQDDPFEGGMLDQMEQGDEAETLPTVYPGSVVYPAAKAADKKAAKGDKKGAKTGADKKGSEKKSSGSPDVLPHLPVQERVDVLDRLPTNRP